MEKNETDEAQIRGLINGYAEAVRAKDVDGAMANYATEVLSFDVVNPLQYKGRAEGRKRPEEWFSSWRGPIGCEIRDLSIVAGENVAFSHQLSRFSGTKTDGGEIDMWVRAILCFRKSGGKWMVTHQHLSVPFDPDNGQASLDLKP